MMSPGRNLGYRFLILALSQVTGGAILAGQPVAIESPARPANGTNPSFTKPAEQRPVSQGGTNRTARAAAPEIPLPEPAKSPVQFFRELLAMTPGQRQVALSNRPPENRKMILAKVREYRSLSENERELRLRATELEWYLAALMKAAPTNRSPGLVSVPEEYRKMIQTRLEEWDRLPDGVKKELLDHRESIRLYLQMTSTVPLQTNSILPRRSPVEERLKKLQMMPEAERQQLISRFKQYFDLNQHEQQKVLHTLSPADQVQISKTLAKFKDLTPQQRNQCIRSFEEFAKMTPADRQQFLKNAERWIIMTPDDRQKWREVVEKVSMMPPSFPTAPKPPPAIQSSNKQASLITNGN